MGKKSKGGIAVLVSMSVLLGLGGCGKPSVSSEGPEAGSSSEAAAASEEKITLTLRHQDVGAGTEAASEATRIAVERFMDDHPNVTVNIETLDQDTHRQKLRAEMAGGMPPDLFFNWGYAEGEPYYEAGRLLDITDALNADPEWKDGFVDGIMDAFNYGDGTYGIPRAGFIEGVFYNKEIFQEAGIAPPATYGELKEAVTRIKEAGYIPIALGNKEKWPSTFIHNFFFERQLGYDYFEALLAREEGYSWVNDDYIEANRKIQELVEMGAFPDGLNAISRDEGVALFYQGKAAMLIDGSWMCTTLASDQAPEGFSDKVGFVNFPAFEDGKGDQNTAISGFTSGYSINADLTGAKKEAAIELLKYLNDDVSAEFQFYECFQLPNREIANMDEEKAGTLFVESVNELNRSTAKLLPHTDVMPSGLMNVYYDVSQGIFDGTLTPEEGMEMMEKASEEYLR